MLKGANLKGGRRPSAPYWPAATAWTYKKLEIKNICWTPTFLWNQSHMSNQIVFQIWSWYPNNSGSCEILFGHYTKKVTPKLFYAAFCHKSIIFCHNITSIIKTVTKYGTLTIRYFQRQAFPQDYKNILFYKTQATQSQSLYMYMFLYLDLYP